MKQINVLLTGGIGSRLWPLSRKSRPKQYIPLFDGKTLFQLAALPLPITLLKTLTHIKAVFNELLNWPQRAIWLRLAFNLPNRKPGTDI